MSEEQVRLDQVRLDPARCTHPEVLPQGVCTNCGALVVLTGRFRPEPVSGNEQESD